MRPFHPWTLLETMWNRPAVFRRPGHPELLRAWNHLHQLLRQSDLAMDEHGHLAAISVSLPPGSLDMFLFETVDGRLRGKIKRLDVCKWRSLHSSGLFRHRFSAVPRFFSIRPGVLVSFLRMNFINS